MTVGSYTSRDFWKAIILYGLNNATYKIALGKTLLELAGRNTTHVAWNVLSEEFLKQYKNRLDNAMMPQQTNPSRQTVAINIRGYNDAQNDVTAIPLHCAGWLFGRTAEPSEPTWSNLAGG